MAMVMKKKYKKFLCSLNALLCSFLVLVLFICCWDIKNHKKEHRNGEWKRKVHKSSVLTAEIFFFIFYVEFTNLWNKKKVL